MSRVIDNSLVLQCLKLNKKGRYSNNSLTIETYFFAPRHTVIGLDIDDSKVVAVEEEGRSDRVDTLSRLDEIVEGGFQFAEKYRGMTDKLIFSGSDRELACAVIDSAIDGG